MYFDDRSLVSASWALVFFYSSNLGLFAIDCDEIMLIYEVLSLSCLFRDFLNAISLKILELI